jgi:hypothetical protein
LRALDDRARDIAALLGGSLEVLERSSLLGAQQGSSED